MEALALTEARNIYCAACAAHSKALEVTEMTRAVCSAASVLYNNAIEADIHKGE